LKIFLKGLLLATVVGIGALFSLSYVSRGDSAPGLTAEGHLFSCPDRPNCVSSEEGEVAPLSFSGSSKTAWQNVRRSIKTLGGSVEKEEGDYLAATFETPFFRFVDDMEFRMVPKKKRIQIRSASRVGYSDMGTNRKRVERFRKVFNQTR